MNSKEYLTHLNKNIQAVALKQTNDAPYTSVFTQRLTYALGKSIYKAGGIPEPEKELPIQRLIHRKNGATDYKTGHLDLFENFHNTTSIAIEIDRTTSCGHWTSLFVHKWNLEAWVYGFAGKAKSP